MKKQLINICGGVVLVAAIGPVQAASGGGGSSQPAANKIPTDKLCVKRSKLYSPGSVVKMNKKTYICKKNPAQNSDQVVWLEKKKKS